MVARWSKPLDWRKFTPDTEIVDDNTPTVIALDPRLYLEGRMETLWKEHGVDFSKIFIDYGNLDFESTTGPIRQKEESKVLAVPSA
jgi:hypothetical protein